MRTLGDDVCKGPHGVGLLARPQVAEAAPSSRPQVTCSSRRQPWERGNFLPPCLSWAAREGPTPSVSSSVILPGRPE